MNDETGLNTPPEPSFSAGERLYAVLSSISMALEVRVDRSDVVALADHATVEEIVVPLTQSASQAGILVREAETASPDEALDFVREGFPVILAEADGTFVVATSVVGSRIDVTEVARRSVSKMMAVAEWRSRLAADPSPRLFIARRELECQSLSRAPSVAGDDHDPAGHHGHASPVQRFAALLALDRRDIWLVVLFAFVGGVLTLATPLAVESLVNVVSWGIYLQPLIVLGLILLTCLGLAGVLKLLQTVVVEMIQRRQFVRIVGDLAHRFPRARGSALEGTYPRELANRLFDIMTIQKATAVLLLDGVTIVLTTLLGMVLLAFYHPFLLGFDIVLLLTMLSLTWVLGSGGIRTAIEESITKYRVVHWLQDVLEMPSAFKASGGETLAIERANSLTAEYIQSRRRQFRVVIRQVAFAISLQVLASTALLALGGWLVIRGQLTLGQLVASELVVTVVVGAFAKAGKSLEKFYDLMAGVDKVGHLVDIPVDRRQHLGELPDGPMPIAWGDLSFRRDAKTSSVAAATVKAGATVAIVGDDVDGRSDLARSMAGLREPSSGLVQIGGYDANGATTDMGGALIGYAGETSIFHGTLQENVDLGRLGVGQNRVRQVLEQVGLSQAVLRLSDGVSTHLQTGGYPLAPSQAIQLTIARAIAAKPRVVIIDGMLDRLNRETRQTIWEALSHPDRSWTLVLVTNRDDVAQLCDSQIAVRKT